MKKVMKNFPKSIAILFLIFSFISFLLLIAGLGDKTGWLMYLIDFIFGVWFLYFGVAIMKNKIETKLFRILSVIYLVIVAIVLTLFLIMTVSLFTQPVVGDDSMGGGVVAVIILNIVYLVLFMVAYANIFLITSKSLFVKIIKFLPALIIITVSCYWLFVVGKEAWQDRVEQQSQVVDDDSGEGSGGLVDSDELFEVSELLLIDRCARVVEYGMEKTYPGFGMQSSDLLESTSLVDEDNLFVRFSPSQIDGTINCTIFLKKGGGYLTAYSINMCSPICKQDLDFVEQTNSGFLSVKDDVWPDIDLTPYTAGREFYNIIYMLPRYGTSILAYEQYSEEELFYILWDGVDFTIN